MGTSVWKLSIYIHLRLISIASIGVMKSVMGELTDSTNRAEGFALVPVVWGFGATIGYACLIGLCLRS